MTYETLRNEGQWRGVKLGDARRTARAIKVGAKLASLAAGSLPQQQGSWGSSLSLDDGIVSPVLVVS